MEILTQCNKYRKSAIDIFADQAFISSVNVKPMTSVNSTHFILSNVT